MTDRHEFVHLDIAKSAAVEQYQLLMRHLPQIIGASALTFCIMVYYLYSKTANAFLFILLGIVLLLSAFRVWTYVVHRRNPINVDNFVPRQNLMAFYSLASGSLWGYLSLLGISADDPQTSLFVIMVLTGLVASATASLSHVPKLFIFFVLPTMLPAAIKYLTIDDNASIWVSVLIVIYLVVSYRFSKDIRNSALQGIMLKFENSNLIDNLTIEKKHAEAARKLAEHSNLAKSKFLAAASHDLRQPLHSLRLFTTTLESKNIGNENSTLANNIGKSVTALESLFDSLLDISKLDAGIVKLSERDFDLQVMLDRISTGFQEQASAKGIGYNTHYKRDFVRTDPVLLERVIYNLISNAIRYTGKGAVSIVAKTSGTSVVLQVIDTGCGIPKDKQSDIFEEFVQLGNPERDRDKGLGLGLSIVKRIIDLLKMPFTLHSDPATGTLVELHIPNGKEVHPVSTEVSMALSIQPLGPLFVAVIDDEEQARLAMSLLLEHWGCTVLAAANVDEVLIALEDYEYDPDAIIADYRLRDKQTGTQAIESIRSHTGINIAAVIITGDVEPAQLRDITEQGFTVLHKPCNPAQLRTFLKQCSIQ